MNKYLTKLAEKHVLEDGVYWDDQTHTMKPGTRYMSEAMNREDRKSRLVSGGIFGSMYGSTLGGMLGVSLARKYNLPKKLGLAGGVAVGVSALGGMGYLLGGLRPVDKPLAKDRILTKLETKHDDRINEIEGWEKFAKEYYQQTKVEDNRIGSRAGMAAVGGVTAGFVNSKIGIPIQNKVNQFLPSPGIQTHHFLKVPGKLGIQLPKGFQSSEPLGRSPQIL